MSNNTNEMIGSVENEFLSIEKGEGWASFFYAIKNECAETHSFSSVEAKKSKNKYLNRYRDVNPYDHSRIVLSKGSSDYINANLVVIEKAKRKYILTQGPLPQTTSHFWLMIWDQNCKAIVMLNRIIEKNMIKCHQYWPSEETSGEDKSLVFSDVNLKVTNVCEVKDANYTTTTLRLEDLGTGNQREVIHYHYTTWPDFGVPQSPTAFLRFLDVVRSSGVLESDVGPAVVHCSAGIGRSGTFCLVDSCIVMIRDMNLKDIIVKDVLMEMRKYRMGLIQTPGQLRFSYLAIIKGINKADSPNGLVDEETEEVKESESEEETPPLPPPRNESLTRSQANNEPNKEEANLATNNVEHNRKQHHTKPSRGGRSSTTRRRHPYKREDRYLHRKHRDRALSHSTVVQNYLEPAGFFAFDCLPRQTCHPYSCDREDPCGARQRKRERGERNQVLENKVKEMKRKLQESESWRKWKKSIFHPWSIGCFIVGGGIIVYALLAARG